jgi:hypothetical protein
MPDERDKGLDATEELDQSLGKIKPRDNYLLTYL